jgi:hypothetical protein
MEYEMENKSKIWQKEQLWGTDTPSIEDLEMSRKPPCRVWKYSGMNARCVSRQSMVF